MTVAKMSAKVMPTYDLHVPPPKENNFLNNSEHVIRAMRFIAMVQTLMGINRLYLWTSKATTLWFSYLYNISLLVFIIYTMAVGDTYDGVHGIIRNATRVEYMILVIISCLFQKKTMLSFINDLGTFDHMINIANEISRSVKLYRAIICVIASIIYSCVEYYLMYAYIMPDEEITASTIIVYIAVMAHDSEIILYVMLVRTAMMRVRILKAHVVKAFGAENDLNNSEDVDKIETLSNNVHLDTTAIHRSYELLHKCAEQLNSFISFPMIVMLFSAGLSTTMLLKNFFQTEADEGNVMFRALTIYTSVRCFKYTMLVVIPCYYASVTSRQVSIIRTTLHNAVNTFKLDKTERRKIKALFQLTKDNEFVYALWGVIRLSMSLPLSYASLCTTYLVITIQFSKFID